MRKGTILLAAAVGCAGLAGCASSGLSHREVRGQDYATYVFAMTEPAPGTVSPGLGALAGDVDATQPARPLKTPARVAVAQLGEVAPPLAMMEKLRAEPELFSSVQPIPGLMDVAAEMDPRGKPHDYSAQKNAQAHAARMRKYARDIGADYLFLYGGTIDRATTASPLILANATIVGAFVVPGEVIQATARASGSLIEVQSGRVVLSVAADGHERKRASSVAREGDEIKVMETLRDEVIDELAEQLKARLKETAVAEQASKS